MPSPDQEVIALQMKQQKNQKSRKSLTEKVKQEQAQRVEGYRKLFPEHLKEDVDRACHYMFLTLYAVNLCDIFKEKGWLIPPSGNSVCNVMIQFK